MSYFGGTRIVLEPFIDGAGFRNQEGVESKLIVFLGLLAENRR